MHSYKQYDIGARGRRDVVRILQIGCILSVTAIAMVGIPVTRSWPRRMTESYLCLLAIGILFSLLILQYLDGRLIINIGKRCRHAVIAAVIITTVSYTMSNHHWMRTAEYLKVLTLFAFIIAVSQVIRNHHQWDRLEQYALIIIAISSIFAICQEYGFGGNIVPLLAKTARHRSCGLARNSLVLSSQLSILLPFAYVRVLNSRKLKNIGLWIFWILL